MVDTIEYCCPICKGGLLSSMGVLSCSMCHARWPVKDGIPCFLEEDFYWGYTSQENMEKVLRIAEKEGWKSGLNFMIQSERSDQRKTYWDYYTSDRRADWRFLLQLSPQSRVLDIGCGLGALSFALCKEVGTVFALDGTCQNVKFIDIRRIQEGITNLFPVNAEIVRLPHLPFPDNYFDLIVIIGVLEWIGDSQVNISPDDLQREVLKKVHAALKPTGNLYLAIENRFGFRYFLGSKDEHSHMRFITFLPRRFASIYSKIIQGKDYRTYTLSYNGLRRLLKRAGFTKTHFFYPVPEYRMPQFLVPLDDQLVFGFFLKYFRRSHPKASKIIYDLSRLGLLVNMQKHLSPAFSVIAEK